MEVIDEVVEIEDLTVMGPLPVRRGNTVGDKS